MTYKLYLSNRLYFSWSIAAYLMFNRFGLGDQVKTTIFRPQSETALRPMMTDLAPAQTLPTAITPDGVVLNDSMAIAEELASRHPDIAFWPTDPLARGSARALANEMHATFGGLRGDWPVNLRTAYATVTPHDNIAAELGRIEEIWTHARKVTGAVGPWLPLWKINLRAGQGANQVLQRINVCAEPSMTDAALCTSASSLMAQSCPWCKARRSSSPLLPCGAQANDYMQALFC